MSSQETREALKADIDGFPALRIGGGYAPACRHAHDEEATGSSAAVRGQCRKRITMAGAVVALDAASSGIEFSLFCVPDDELDRPSLA